jgi:cytidylate kinase
MYYINSGNLYRAITWQILREYSGQPPEEPDKLIELAKNCQVELKPDGFYVNSVRVEDYLHTDAVDTWVAQVSSISEIRSIVNADLREIALNVQSVVEGRDITTVVFPDAKVKIFLDASVETRAKRRYYQSVSELSIKEIEKRIRRRDQIDRNKAVGRLEVAEDALYLDTSDLTIDQVCEKVIDKIQKTVQ